MAIPAGLVHEKAVQNLFDHPFRMNLPTRLRQPNHYGDSGERVPLERIVTTVPVVPNGTVASSAGSVATSASVTNPPSKRQKTERFLKLREEVDKNTNAWIIDWIYQTAEKSAKLGETSFITPLKLLKIDFEDHKAVLDKVKIVVELIEKEGFKVETVCVDHQTCTRSCSQNALKISFYD